MNEDTKKRKQIQQLESSIANLEKKLKQKNVSDSHPPQWQESAAKYLIQLRKKLEELKSEELKNDPQV